VLTSLEREIAIARATAAEADNLRKEIERLSNSVEFLERERDKAGATARGAGGDDRCHSGRHLSD